MNINDALIKGKNILKENGITSYIIDCELILAKVLNKDRLYVIVNKNYELNNEAQIKFFELISLRKDNMPVKYILHETEFMGINFYIQEGVLIPRPDTEILCEEVINIIKENNYINICDVCCGSGAIGISIAKNLKDIICDCIDISDIAVKVTQTNINNQNLEGRVSVIKGNLLNSALNDKKEYDVIVSNPPYIKTGDINNLMKDVKDYEPHIALDGGEDGLLFYKKIINQSKNVLQNNGLIAFEIGYDEADEVCSLLENNDYINIKVIKDLANLNRVVFANKRN